MIGIHKTEGIFSVHLLIFVNIKLSATAIDD
jgi:hypothetical protein